MAVEGASLECRDHACTRPTVEIALHSEPTGNGVVEGQCVTLICTAHILSSIRGDVEFAVWRRDPGQSSE